ncbi:MAG: LTA synthase family protein [Candidatus Rifleibacteriota bacterium]
MLTLMAISFLYKIFHFWFTAGSATEVSFPNLTYVSISFLEAVVLFGLINRVQNKKTKYSIAFVINLAFGILLHGIYMYYRLFAVPLSFSLILFVRNIGDIGSSIFELFHYSDLSIYLIDCFVFIFFFSKKIKTRLEKTDAFFFSISRTKFNIIVLFFAILWAASVEPQGSWKEPFYRDEIEAILTFSPFGYCCSEFAKGFRDMLITPEIDQYKRDFINKVLAREKKIYDSSTNIIPWVENYDHKNPNIVILQFESLMYGYLNRKINGKAVTPVLDRLASNSVFLSSFFSDCIATADSDFSVLTSLFPHYKKSAHLSYFENHFPSLPKFLKSKGYTSIYCNAAPKTFWNATEFSKNIGFDKIVLGDDLKPGKKVGKWLNDIDFLEQATERLETLPRPFFGMFLTTSSHHPFNFKELPKVFTKEQSPELSEEMLNYANAINYTDTAIGIFLDRMKDLGLLDNTVFLIYGDHPMILRYQEAALSRQYGHLEECEKVIRFFNSNIPCMIYAPGILKPQIINKLCTQTDLAPTVLSIGRWKKPRRFLGNSVFSDTPGFAFHKFFIGCTDTKFFHGRIFEGNNFKYILDRKTLQKAESDKEIKRIFDLGQTSEWIIEYDYQ